MIDRYRQQGWSPGLLSDWVLIGKVFFLNTFLVPMILLTFCIFNGTVMSDLQSYAKNHGNFSVPMSQFYTFFQGSVFDTAIFEEFHYRIYTWVLVNVLSFSLYAGKRLNYRISDRWTIRWLMVWFLIWDVAIISNTLWTQTHFPKFNYIMIPAFIAGMSWNYLIIKTGKIWPAIVSHGIANLSIYFLIKVLQLLEVPTVT